MLDRNRRDRGALVALALILAAVVLLAAIAAFEKTQCQPGNSPASCAQSDGGDQNQDKTAGGAWPQFSPQDTYAQWIMAFFTIVATGVSVWAVRLLQLTLAATKLATDSAAKGVEHAAEMNAITQAAFANDLRPWISVDGLEIRHVEVQGGRFRVLASVMVKNVGRSPAVDVRLSVGFYRLGANVRHARSLDDFCTKCGIEPEPGGRNRILFPGSEPEEFRRSTANDLVEGEIPNVVGVRVFACVTYRSKISGDAIYYTGTVMVATTDPVRFLGDRDEVIQGDELQVMVSGEYNTMT